jgi:hypothetical protein
MKHQLQLGTESGIVSNEAIKQLMLITDLARTVQLWTPALALTRTIWSSRSYWLRAVAISWSLLPLCVNRRSNLTPHRRPILTPSGAGFWR